MFGQNLFAIEETSMTGGHKPSGITFKVDLQGNFFFFAWNELVVEADTIIIFQRLMDRQGMDGYGSCVGRGG